MADVNVQIKQRNGAIWDNLYPKTKAELVVESASKRFVSDAEKTAWNGKQNALGFTPVDSASKNVANGFVGLDSNVKIPEQYLPNITITDTFVVASQTAMLSLDAQIGDVAIRTDLNTSFILKTSGATVLANWQELLAPLSKVVSVNGKVGAVTVTATDVGLGNVTNESKTTMFASPTFTGSPKAPTQLASVNDTTLATTEFANRIANTKAKITVSATEPTSPVNSDLWYEIV